ncbi:hypothetical protein TcCL_ESM04023 [Trypanosoma cruzi]|nr:hypothetical protein TcCL_ESM04023 [Trypanosoma cruzi]
MEDVLMNDACLILVFLLWCVAAIGDETVLDEGTPSGSLVCPSIFRTESANEFFEYWKRKNADFLSVSIIAASCSFYSLSHFCASCGLNLFRVASRDHQASPIAATDPRRNKNKNNKWNDCSLFAFKVTTA